MLTPYVGFISTDNGMLIIYVDAEDFDDAREQLDLYVSKFLRPTHSRGYFAGRVMWVEAWNQNLEDDFKHVLQGCTSKYLTLEDY